MRPTTIVLVAAGMLAIVPAEGCKQGPSLPVDPASKDAEIVTAVPAAADAAATSAEPAGEDVSDVAEVNLPPIVDSLGSTDIPDSTSPSEAFDAQDTFVWQDMAVVPPPAVCTATGALPNPGEPCLTEGVVRCTNWQAWAQKYFDPYTHVCIRPWRVRCTAAAGSLVWTPEGCGKLPADCKAMWGYSQFTCQENSRGATCCPTEHVSNALDPTSKTEYQPFVTMCTPDWEGKRWCGWVSNESPYYADFVFQCGFADTVPADPWTQKDTKNAFVKCLNYCKDCLYFYHHLKCYPINHNYCLNQGSSKPIMESAMCLDTIPGKGPTCAKDCADFKYSKFWPGK